jgi:UDP-N-acetylglucosamine 2-epimerase (non-hydrolysing)
MIEQFGLSSAINSEAVRIIEPLGYLDFLKLQSNAHFVLTDSGGIQEETTYLGIPCITLRDNTERPVTVTEGTNVITGTDPDKVRNEAEKILDGNGKKGVIPEYWDGNTAERITSILLEKLV